MRCLIAMKDTPPVMSDHKEAVENAKGQRWHSEEVHRGNGFPMIAQERGPSVCRLRTPRCLPHPAQDGSFRNIEAKHRKLSVDAWRTPVWILGDHTEDEFPQFNADALTA